MSVGGGTEKLPPGAAVVAVVVVDAGWADRFDEHAARLYTASAAATPPAASQERPAVDPGALRGLVGGRQHLAQHVGVVSVRRSGHELAVGDGSRR